MKRLLAIFICFLAACAAAHADNVVMQSQTVQPLIFNMVESADHITPLTGASPTVVISKNGASFASPSGSVSEIGDGWYEVAGNTSDTATLGKLIVHATATSGDPSDTAYLVVAYNPLSATNLGLSALPTASVGASGGLPTGDSSGRVLLQPTQTGVTIPTVTTVTNAVTVTGSVNVGSIDGYAALAGSSVVFPSSIGTSMYSGGAVASVTAPVAVGSYSSNEDPATLVLGATASSWNTAGTIGAKINSAGSASDPWSTALPGSYTSGEAGYILGTYLTAAPPTSSTIANAVAAKFIFDGSGFVKSDPQTGVNVTQIGSQNVTLDANNLLETDAADWNGNAISTVTPNTASVTVTTNNDKTGYSLTQAFPTNFSSQSIDISGRVLLQPSQPSVTIPTVTAVTNGVTVTTNNDKTGYSLATTPPTAAQIAAVILKTPANLLATDSSGDVTFNNTTIGSTGSVTTPVVTNQTVLRGTATAGTTTSITFATGASTVTGMYIGDLIVITSGTGAQESAPITGYNGATLTATVASWPATTPNTTSVYAVLAWSATSGGGGTVNANLVSIGGTSVSASSTVDFGLLNAINGNAATAATASTDNETLITSANTGIANLATTLAAGLNVSQWAGSTATVDANGLPNVSAADWNGTTITTGVPNTASVTVGGYSANENPATLVWEAAPASFDAPGTFGYLVQNSGSSLTAAQVWAYSSRTLSTAPPTTSQIAASILATPANLLSTDSSGRVTPVPTTPIGPGR